VGHKNTPKVSDTVVGEGEVKRGVPGRKKTFFADKYNEQQWLLADNIVFTPRLQLHRPGQHTQRQLLYAAEPQRADEENKHTVGAESYYCYTIATLCSPTLALLFRVSGRRLNHVTTRCCSIINFQVAPS